MSYRYRHPFGSLRWEVPFAPDMMRPAPAFDKLPAAYAAGQPYGQDFPQYISVQPGKYALKRLLLRLVQLVAANSISDYQEFLLQAEPHTSTLSQQQLRTALGVDSSSSSLYTAALSHQTVRHSASHALTSCF